MTDTTQAVDLLLALRDAIDEAVHALVKLPQVEADRDYWQKEHAKVLNESIKHGEAMMGNVLLAVMKGKL